MLWYVFYRANPFESPRAMRFNRGTAARAEAALIEYLRGHPQASYREAGQAAGRSKPWAVEVCQGLAAAGKLHRNGDGWEVRG